MGGKALKNFGVRRVDPATYERIKAFVLSRLAPACLRAEVPLCLADKPDHGDVDILAIIDPAIGDLGAWIDATFAPRGHVKTPEGIHSFTIEDLQIDLIPTTAERWGSHYTYLCWGDLSMVIGRLARTFDLKYGIDGLAIAVRRPATDDEFASLIISRRPAEILSFLGYDYARWKEGFRSEAEVRAFAFSSDRMHRGFTDADSENTKHRKRELTRGAYRRYHDWVESHADQFPLVPRNSMPADRLERCAYIEARFPGSQLVERYKAAQKRGDRFRLAKAKFSSDHLTALYPDLVGARLGAYNRLWLKQWPSKEAQVAFILSAEISELHALAATAYAAMAPAAIS